MCIICDHYNKDLLTLKEAWTNLGEMYNTLEPDHRTTLTDKLMDDAIYGDEEIAADLWHAIFQGILQ